MGNQCSGDGEASPTKETSFKSFKAETRTTKSTNAQALYQFDYDPVNLNHDPDIVSKDPFDYEDEEFTVFRPGTTKKIGHNSRYKAEGGCNLSSYPQSHFYG